MNKFDQVSSDDHQISLTGGSKSRGWGQGVPGLMCRGAGVGVGGCCFTVRWILANGHMGNPPLNKQTQVETLSSRNLVVWR